jgi:hypothetical protein
MDEITRINISEYKKHNRKFTKNANCVLGTPLPFRAKKQKVTDNGYNRFAAIINPTGKIAKFRDCLQTKDIDGATPNAFGKLKQIKGRDYINIGDIKGRL